MVPSKNPPGARVRRLWSAARLLVTTLFIIGCGSSDSTGVTEPDPDVAPFVGDWEAVTFDVTNLADDTEVFRVVAAGSFTLNVQPSGFYTAVLHISGAQPIPENGQLSVIGSSVRLSPNGGPAITASFEFMGSDRVELIGPTEFDFNFDGEPESATAHIVLERS